MREALTYAYAGTQCSFLSHESNCRLAQSCRMQMRVKPLVVKPIVDRWRLAFEQEDPRRSPPVADEICHLRRLS